MSRFMSYFPVLTHASLALLLALGLTLPRHASAQDEGNEETEGGTSSGQPNVTVRIDPTSYQTTSTPSAAPDLNSYLPSSSKPMTGESSDTFDLNVRSGSSVVLSGNGEADAYGGGDDFGALESGKLKKAGAAKVPEFHVVKKGDTLWQISGGYYGDPHEWPRLWSMNPQIENPHWIYPGDQLRTASTGASGPGMSSALARSEDNSAGGGGFVGRDRMVPAGTIFLRDQGYIGDPERDVWGELVGAREDQMMLGEGNSVYLLMKDGVDLRLGQRLTIFQEVRTPSGVEGARKPPGDLVKVYGTVRVDAWDKKERIARGQIIESLDVVERGAKVGPVGRRFDVVPPKKATKEVEARVLTSVYPHIYFGRNQIVFIDKGSEDGLAAGNRLRVVERGDTWRRSLKKSSPYQRMRVVLDSPEEAAAEKTPLHGNDDKFPDEVTGEVTVLRTEKYTAACLVSESSHELEVGSRLVATPGY